MPRRTILERVAKRLLPAKPATPIQKWRADGGDAAMRYSYDLNAGSVVFDLGGYEGRWAEEIHRRYACRVLIFEPVARFAEAIRKQFADDSALEVYAYGLGASTRSENIHLSADGSSVFGNAEEVVPIELVDAKLWIEDHAITHIALMKINIEGGEYELLERLIETGLIEIIDDVQVQFHDIAPDSRARMEHIQTALSKTHEPTYQYDFIWENWTRKR